VYRESVARGCWCARAIPWPAGCMRAFAAPTIMPGACCMRLLHILLRKRRPHCKAMALASSPSSAACGWPAAALASLAALVLASSSAVAAQAVSTDGRLSKSEALGVVSNPPSVAPCCLALMIGVYLAFRSSCGAGSSATQTAFAAFLVPLAVTCATFLSASWMVCLMSNTH
jgi:hypothetical protein